MKKQILFLLALFFCTNLFSQVVIKSYTKINISSKGLFGKIETISETIIAAIQNGNKIKSPRVNDIYKFAEPKFVDIFPLLLASKEVVDNDVIYRQKIIGQNASTITISFDVLKLSKKAELYIYNSEGTVIVGPITANENIGKGRFWSTNSFQGNSIILELKTPKNEIQLNELHIGKVLMGFPENNNKSLTDSVGFGHFNTSSSCNINVLCPEGSAWINERKAICMIETDDGGFGSGALLNNTCNVNRPYLLTAWHITNGRNPNNWTYIFGWWSSTCSPNTNNQQAILFNGASLRASYEPTDVSLLELFQNPSSNLDLTFLGWSRSTTSPSTSVGIHHPSGDQMKISFATNPASIGNIGLNSNTAWRVLWSAGIAQPGSSGSPLFDPNQRVVGQLYSITQPAEPPCNQQTGGTNYGRFDLSWSGGGTNETRLSNWLDPTNSGAVSTNTTNISSLTNFNLVLSIDGSSSICNLTGDYTVNGVPPGISVVWVSSNQSIATVSQNGTSTTVTKIGIGNVTITATVGGDCFSNNIASKTIAVGVADNTALSVYSSSSNVCPNLPMPFVALYPNRCDLLSAEWEVDPADANINYNQGFPCEITNNNTGATISFSSYGTHAVRVKVQNSCGWSGWSQPKYIQVSCGYGFSVSPNPATNTVTVQSNQKTNSTITQLRIFDNNGILKKQSKFGIGARQAQMNVSDLKTGIYLIEITSGQNIERQQLFIQK